MRPGHCDVEAPQLRNFGGIHKAACHYPVEHWPMSQAEMETPTETAA